MGTYASVRALVEQSERVKGNSTRKSGIDSMFVFDGSNEPNGEKEGLAGGPRSFLGFCDHSVY